MTQQNQFVAPPTMGVVMPRQFVEELHQYFLTQPMSLAEKPVQMIRQCLAIADEHARAAAEAQAAAVADDQARADMQAAIQSKPEDSHTPLRRAAETFADVAERGEIKVSQPSKSKG